jgi:hypothetical protein
MCVHGALLHPNHFVVKGMNSWTLTCCATGVVRKDGEQQEQQQSSTGE